MEFLKGYGLGFGAQDSKLKFKLGILQEYQGLMRISHGRGTYWQGVQESCSKLGSI